MKHETFCYILQRSHLLRAAERALDRLTEEVASEPYGDAKNSEAFHAACRVVESIREHWARGE